MLMNQNKTKSASSPRADINLSDLNELDGISLDEPPKPKIRPSFTDIGILFLEVLNLMIII